MRILGPDGKPISTNPQPSSEVIQAVEQVRQIAQEGNLEGALQQMSMVFQADVVSDLVIETTLNLLREIASAAGVQPEPQLLPDGTPRPPTEIEIFEALQEDRKNPMAYYQMGSRFFQMGRPAMGLPFFVQARNIIFELAPADLQQASQDYLQLRQAIEVDYSQTLMDSGSYEEAIEAFHALNDTYGGLPIWLLLEMAECYALLRQMDEAQAVYEMATPEAAAGFAGMEEVREEIGDLLARVYDFDDDTEMTLRQWHYVQTRGILVETNGQEELPGERFVLWQPSEEDIAWVTGQTAAMLEQMELAPNKILWLGESSETLARIFARWWEIAPENIRAYQPGDNNDSEDELALLCMAHSYDIPDEETLAELAAARPGLILFALDLHWTDRQPITPDIAGFMSQICNLPWETRIEMSEDQQSAAQVEDTRTPDEAADAVAALFGEEAELEEAARELLALYEPCSDLIINHRDASLSRRPLPLHSPAKSPRFGI